MMIAILGFKKLFKDEDGQGMVEYALILALVAIVVIAAVIFLGDSANNVFTRAVNEVSAAKGG
ncbi:MAG: Flp family type IVb pilin [Saccharofermentanales bacterium]